MFVLCLFDDRAISIFKYLSPVRDFSSRFHVWEVELDTDKAVSGEFGVEESDEGRVHWASSSVCDDDACRRLEDFCWDGVD